MKVVWFTNTPSLAESYINDRPVGGGWIKSLEKAIQKKVELSVVFYHHKDIEPFKFGETTYYPIKRKTGRLAEFQSRIFNMLEPKEELSVFLKVVRSINPDLIHIHGTESQFGLIQLYIDVPTIVSIQGIISVYTYKYYSGINYIDVLKYTRLSDFILFKSYIQLYKSFQKTALREKNIFKQTKNIIGRTSWDKRVSKVLAPNAIYYHNDEILRDVFYKECWSSRPGDTLHIFTTTGPYLYKGLETIFYTAQLLDKLNIKYKWKIAGVSKETKVAQLALRKIKGQITHNIEILGTLGEDELINHLLQTHIYIMASHIENSPNNLCEAQILGIPCIATLAGGTASLMKDNEDGILIQDGDPYAMAGAIIELFNNSDKAKLFGQNARKKALLRHNPVKIAY
jgi:glycosyltransferase involved in cell wall biosynthesis